MTRAPAAALFAIGLSVLVVFGAGSFSAGIVSTLSRQSDIAPTIEEHVVDERVLLSGQSATLAAAALQDRIRAAAQSAGLRLSRIEVRQPEGSGQPLTALIETRGDNDRILRFLYELEASLPAIITYEAAFRRLPEAPGAGRDVLVLNAEFRAWRHDGQGGP